MSKTGYSARTRGPRGIAKHSRGAALVSSLLLLLLLSAITVAMVLSSNSDMLINGYYSGFRGAFYAADSGLNVVRQDMVNHIRAAGTSSFSSTTPPIPAGTEGTVASYLNTTYGSSFQPLNAGQASLSYAEKFKLDTTGTQLTVPSAPACAATDSKGNCTEWDYIYNYSLRAFGRSMGNQVTTISDSGQIIYKVLGTGGSSTVSFSAYGMFIDQYNICNGSTLVPGTISGPVFTNGAWNFGTSGSYIFTDTVGSANSNFGYQFSGACKQSSASSYKSGSSTIAPQFQAGYNLGQNKIPLPGDDYDQQHAVLDGKGTNDTAPSAAEMNASLKGVTGSAYPTSGASTGVFLPYSYDAASGKNIFTGGGIYVQGDASVTLSTSGATGQVYTIKQGSVTTTITVDTGSNTTTMSSGGKTVSISGVPQQLDANGVFQRDATLLYVNGNITALSGPGQGVAAVSDATALTITATNNVTITGDVLYTHEPVTQTQNQIHGTPADTLIPGNDHGQVLGIYTNKGDIQLNNKQSNGNLEIDASIATISDNGSGGLVNTGSSINTLNIVGGRIQNAIKNIGSTTRNVFFDRRFAKNNFAPPWFPSTTVTATGPTVATYRPTVQRLRWINNTSYY